MEEKRLQSSGIVGAWTEIPPSSDAAPEFDTVVDAERASITLRDSDVPLVGSAHRSTQYGVGTTSEATSNASARQRDGERKRRPAERAREDSLSFDLENRSDTWKEWSKVVLSRGVVLYPFVPFLVYHAWQCWGRPSVRLATLVIPAYLLWLFVFRLRKDDQEVRFSQRTTLLVGGCLLAATFGAILGAIGQSIGSIIVMWSGWAAMYSWLLYRVPSLSRKGIAMTLLPLALCMPVSIQCIEQLQGMVEVLATWCGSGVLDRFELRHHPIQNGLDLGTMLYPIEDPFDGLGGLFLLLLASTVFAIVFRRSPLQVTLLIGLSPLVLLLGHLTHLVTYLLPTVIWLEGRVHPQWTSVVALAVLTLEVVAMGLWDRVLGELLEPVPAAPYTMNRFLRATSRSTQKAKGSKSSGRDEVVSSWIPEGLLSASYPLLVAATVMLSVSTLFYFVQRVFGPW